MKYFYSTNNKVCAQSIEVEVENDSIVSVKFNGGCDGNLKGISALLKGMKAQDAIERMSGIQCRTKGTSCPDQISKALQKALAE